MSQIPFNEPFIAGKELFYIAQAVALGNIAGDGHFTMGCANLLEERYGISKVLMMPSCTAALETAAMLCDLQPGDEVIMPSYTFVSTANAVARLGAKPVFVDVRPDTLNIDETLIQAAITDRTKAIFPVHYGGVGCEMDLIMKIASDHDLVVVEDAAQGVNAFYKERALGSIGHLATFSFHETKNYICGEGGALCINADRFLQQAEIIRDKGTNRQQFFRGEIDKYTWVDIGSSYVPSEITCAFLYGQLELLDEIAARRREIFEAYRRQLIPLEKVGVVKLPVVPKHCVTNYHLFYLLVKDRSVRDQLLSYLKSSGIHAVFHYVPLHSSPKGRELGCDVPLPVTDDVAGRLIRLPLYHGLTADKRAKVVDAIKSFFEKDCSSPSESRQASDGFESGE